MSGRHGGLRPRWPRGGEWVWALSAAGLVLNGLRLRGRIRALTVAEAGLRAGVVAEDEARDGGASGGEGHRFVLVVADGVHVTPDGRAAAVAHAAAERLELLELVPADLDADRVLDLVRQVDPATYRDDRLARGHGAGQAVLVDRSLLSRLDAGEPGGALTEADVAALAAQAKLFAPTGCDLAVAAGVHAARETADGRRAFLDVGHRSAAPMAAALPLVGLAGLAAGTVLAPGWAALAAAAYCAQPALALRGGPLSRRPPARELATRPARSLQRAVRLAAAVRRHGRPVAPGRGAHDRRGEVARELEEHDEREEREERDEREEAARARYAEVMAGGTDHFFAPRRDDCPWCGATDLSLLVECGDVLQQKPGIFRLDRCRACAHVFQNPALSPAGLDFYYGDFYDGLGAEDLEAVFTSSARPYEDRADLVRRHLGGPEPEVWLDVGTGHGHFCLMARRTFPTTRFEGLDLGGAVATAARRGWIDAAHQGLLPEAAPALAGRFDVVSMHHYLEHTRDPDAELAAARTALRPGGHLLVEVPDPACRAGTLLGRWWGPWFQPQHQHMVPFENLRDRLDRHGFTVVATERQAAHLPVEASMAAWLLLNHLGPKVGQPWQPPATAAGTARRAAVFTVGAPVLALGLLVDKVAGPLIGHLPHGPNAYRILARVNDRGAEVGSR